MAVRRTLTRPAPQGRLARRRRAQRHRGALQGGQGAHRDDDLRVPAPLARVCDGGAGAQVLRRGTDVQRQGWAAPFFRFRLYLSSLSAFSLSSSLDFLSAFSLPPLPVFSFRLFTSTLSSHPFLCPPTFTFTFHHFSPLFTVPPFPICYFISHNVAPLVPAKLFAEADARRSHPCAGRDHPVADTLRRVLREVPARRQAVRPTAQAVREEDHPAALLPRPCRRYARRPGLTTRPQSSRSPSTFTTSWSTRTARRRVGSPCPRSTASRRSTRWRSSPCSRAARS